MFFAYLPFGSISLIHLEKLKIKGIVLQPVLYTLLNIFTKHPNEFIPNQSLADSIWDKDSKLDPFPNLRVHINSLRNQIVQGREGLQKKDVIENRVGYGYRLIDSSREEKNTMAKNLKQESEGEDLYVHPGFTEKKSQEEYLYVHPAFTWDRMTQQIIIGEQEVSLTELEGQVLNIFTRSPNVIFSPNQLVRLTNRNLNLHTIKITIYSLRRKILGDNSKMTLIENRRGYGYLFNDKEFSEE